MYSSRHRTRESAEEPICVAGKEWRAVEDDGDFRAVSADVNKLQKVRQRSMLLVSLGDCAVTGNVPAMRNSIPVSKLLLRIYVEGADEGKAIPSERLPALLRQARPLREFVKVDLCLPGCPPPARIIAGVLQDLVQGKKPEVLGPKFG